MTLQTRPRTDSTYDWREDGEQVRWHLIENETNKRVAPATGDDPVSLDDIEAAIERLEEAAEAN